MSPIARQVVWVGLGGAVGAIGRYGLLYWLGSVDDGSLPWGTLVANVLGSLLLGVVIGLVERGAFHEGMRLFLAVGLLGGFTTFSFFSYENLELLRDNRIVSLLLSVTAQLVVGLAGAAVGYLLGERAYR